MAASARTFKADLERWAGKVSVGLDALARQTCFEISHRVVIDTNVDTGFLRGSWQPSIGAPAAKTGAAEDPGGGIALGEIGLVCQGVKAGDVFWMWNNAAYALRLEFGFVGTDALGRSYNQPGYYFVTSNLKKGPQVVDEIARKFLPK